MQQKSSTFPIARLGAITGWLTLAGIMSFSVIGPMLVAGQRVSGSLDATAIQTYYNHAALAPLNAGEFVVMLFFLPFTLAMRELLAGDDRSRFLATLGFAFALAA